MRKITLTLLLLLSFSPATYASFSSALESYQRGNLTVAASEFNKLAERNDPDAQYMLGYMYALGEGLRQNYVESHKWLNLAASRGKEGAREARDRVASRMSRNQIVRAQQLARNWKPQPIIAAPTYINPQPTSKVRVYVDSRNTIRNVQSRLSKLGYDPGPADGAPGRRTRNAISQYQQDNGLRVNGEITNDLVAHLLPAAIANKPAWGYPQVWAAPVKKNSRETRVLIQDLEKLIETIKSKKAAERWVIKDLRKLVRKNQLAWPNLLLNERFSRRNYKLNRNWKVTSGRFHIESGRGLVSEVRTSKTSRGNGREELANAIINSFLGNDNSKLRGRHVAQISTNRKISNAFAVRAQVASIDRKSRIALMFNQAGKKDSGYRLVINTGGKRDEISLLRINRSKRTLIDSYTGRLNLANNSAHNIEWIRNRSGGMAIAIDGRELIRVTNSEIRGEFTQLSITNVGGNYMLQNVMLFDSSH